MVALQPVRTWGTRADGARGSLTGEWERLVKSTFEDETKHRQMMEVGYCTAPLLSEAEVEMLRQEIARLRPSLDFTTPATSSILYHASFLDSDPEYRKDAYELVREALQPKLLRLLPDYVPVAGGLLVKEAGTGEVDMHCDWTSTRDTADVNIAVWCPLLDVDDNNGALSVIPGSHKITDNVVAARLPRYWTAYREELKAMTQPVPLKAGEALFFDVSLLHWSRKNVSDHARIVANLLVVPKEAQPVLYVANEEFSRLDLFDMSDGGMFAYSPSQLFSGDVNTRLIETIPNPNIALSYEEFMRRLAARATGPINRNHSPKQGARKWVARWMGL
jgi:hypothetical protein